MLCTFGSSLADSCTCLGISDACSGGHYCYGGKCTSENKCGGGLCTTACACVSDTGKIAQKCEGASKYCAGGKVMTLCTKDSLFGEECACTLGDEGICTGLCYGDKCSTHELCEYDNHKQSDCVCVPEGKKFGVIKKTWGSKCQKSGDLVWLDDVCKDSTSLSDSCYCAQGVNCDECVSNPSRPGCDVCSKCAAGSTCVETTCIEGVCGDWPCDSVCWCAGDHKNGEICVGASQKCVNGEIVRVSAPKVCADEYDYSDVCVCSAGSGTACGVFGTCDGADCYDRESSSCVQNRIADKTCICYKSQQRSLIAREGDYCKKQNDDYSVIRVCRPYEPDFTQKCHCGSENGPECAVGDVCIEGKCYGTGSGGAAATAAYCQYGVSCSTICACADVFFTQAELCDGAGMQCVGGVVVEKCAPDALIDSFCNCTAESAAQCGAGSVCLGQQCTAKDDLKDLCATADVCASPCVCWKSGAKTAVLCSGAD